MRRHNTGLIAFGIVPVCLALVHSAWADYAISTVAAGPMAFTWRVTSSLNQPIASIRLLGPVQGEPGGTAEPPGWVWTGNPMNPGGARYSWERPNNLMNGSWDFTWTGTIPYGNVAASEIWIDYFDDANVRQWVQLTMPAAPTVANWGFVPVPEPGTLSFMVLGGLAVTLRRRAR